MLIARYRICCLDWAWGLTRQHDASLALKVRRLTGDEAVMAMTQAIQPLMSLYAESSCTKFQSLLSVMECPLPKCCHSRVICGACCRTARSSRPVESSLLQTCQYVIAMLLRGKSPAFLPQSMHHSIEPNPGCNRWHCCSVSAPDPRALKIPASSPATQHEILFMKPRISILSPDHLQLVGPLLIQNTSAGS